MNIPTYIRKVCGVLLAIVVSQLTLSSCDSIIYDDEGDCSVYYRLKFRYDRNLKWADAFANEVSSVHLYAFDKNGVLVWDKAERIDRDTADDYSMLLDLPAGDYQLLAWCGLENDGEREESFTVPTAVVGSTRMDELQCELNRLRDENGTYSKSHLYPLFHGRLDVTLPENLDGGEYVYTMPLTKNTNHIRVILQHLSGKDMDARKFNFNIEDDNSLLGYDNEPLAGENIVYLPWDKQEGEAGVGKTDSRASVIYVKGVIADLTVSRMMASHRDKMILNITSDNGRHIASIPVIHYALLSKEYYEEEYSRKMDDQEFLDREDDYVITLFLDENNDWLSTTILIHSWRVVRQSVDLN